ncbi:MAG TPA: 16S rRNA (guanine(527)-N(7))-methyltransferase RsmG [Puia sp.]|jgi:16S rRNA (guanine527-N7)-methyltransferase
MEKAPADLELVLSYFAGFSPRQLQQLAALGDLYRDWNEKINSISRKDIGSLYEKHVLHSLAIAAAFTWPPGAEILDIGTGGGFPGIPLAIFFPEQHFHLVDSIGKKIKVVEGVREAIGLQNVSTQHGRAEEIKNRKFDCVVSRAVAPLKDLWTWSRPLLRKAPRPSTAHTPSSDTHPPADSPAAADSDLLIPHGLICLKGGDLAAEISDSGCRPRIMEIHEIFAREYFLEKYLLYVPAP